MISPNTSAEMRLEMLFSPMVRGENSGSTPFYVSCIPVSSGRKDGYSESLVPKHSTTRLEEVLDFLDRLSPPSAIPRSLRDSFEGQGEQDVHFH